jgi:sugar fermentation stimulation protein A
VQFRQPLVRGRFIAREKRFIVHVQLDDGGRVTAHTNNTGSMKSCLAPDYAVWLSPAANPARRLKWSLEIVEVPAPPDPACPVLVGVNTALANRLAAEALTAGLIPPLAGFATMTAEVPYGSRGSRADFLLQGDRDRIWVEVKNVSLVEDGRARFPDAPTVRGQKHLHELMEVVAAGDRAALILCSQRRDARLVSPADDIDPEYGRLLRLAEACGVEIFGLRALVTKSGVEPESLIPLAVD